MDDTLFDPSRYGPGRDARRPPSEQGQIVENHGDWYVLMRHRKTPHPLAHRLRRKVATITVLGKQQQTEWRVGMPWEGCWQTHCGLKGAAIEVPEGPVRACEKCGEVVWAAKARHV